MHMLGEEEREVDGLEEREEDGGEKGLEVEDSSALRFSRSANVSFVARVDASQDLKLSSGSGSEGLGAVFLNEAESGAPKVSFSCRLFAMTNVDEKNGEVSWSCERARGSEECFCSKEFLSINVVMGLYGGVEGARQI